MGQYKILYRLVFNYASRLNRNGMAPVSLECRQGNRKIYLSSKVMLYPNQWNGNKVVNHENADKLTVWLVKWKNSIEEIELDSILKGRHISLHQLKDAIKTGVHSRVSLRQFVESVICNDSRRCENTRRGYIYLVNDIYGSFGELSVEEVTYDIVTRYRESMRRKGLSENSIKGKLKMLRCIIEEARLRDLVEKNPFDSIIIGNMTARVEYLDSKEIRKLERLTLSGKEEIVLDLFLFSCYTGFRFSDLSTLEEAELKNGVLIKKMKKTRHYVSIPIDKLFWGKARAIWDKYPNIKTLSHCASNTTFNRMIKEIGAKAGVKKNLHCHLARKTFSNTLTAMGMGVNEVSVLLGHRDVKVTKTHYLFNETELMMKSVNKIFK